MGRGEVPGRGAYLAETAAETATAGEEFLHAHDRGDDECDFAEDEGFGGHQRESAEDDWDDGEDLGGDADHYWQQRLLQFPS